MSTAATIRERPIIFSGEMVRAILDGRKTQTRRVIKPQRDYCCLYGKPGDRLWVRETWCLGDDLDGNEAIYFRADAPPGDYIWSPSIHMHREASRITLEVTDVRVERVQEISADDAEAEGIPTHVVEHTFRKCYRGAGERAAKRIEYFSRLWDNLNAKRGYGWDANPWVWVVAFRRHTGSTTNAV